LQTVHDAESKVDADDAVNRESSLTVAALALVNDRLAGRLEPQRLAKTEGGPVRHAHNGQAGTRHIHA
jgi:hypothetical protein